MPSNVRCDPPSLDRGASVPPSPVATCTLVTAIRRREPGTERCWIDDYVSYDDGATWSFLSFVGDTGIANGNPPALLRLADGRLCCVYGNRTRREVLARMSELGGKPEARRTGPLGRGPAAYPGATWGPEWVLRTGYSSPEDDEDFGYPRLLQRADGRLVAIYYWADERCPTQHIAATIWEPAGR
jgi:hypothetical protein